jgi:hypothetical protein
MASRKTIVKVLNKGKASNPFKRNQWVKIKNNNQVIFRIIRGAGLTGLTGNQI